jgi:hypothetical protein
LVEIAARQIVLSPISDACASRLKTKGAGVWCVASSADRATCRVTSLANGEAARNGGR